MVESLRVIVTPGAEADLVEIRNYISNELHASGTAEKYLDALYGEIDKLSHFGASIAPVPEEPWHSRKLRKIAIRNFYAYFWIDEKAGNIYIVTIIYKKRDQMKILNEKLNFHS